MRPTQTSMSLPQANLWRSVWILLHLRLVIWFGGFRRARLRRKIGLVLLGILVITGFGFVLYLSWLLLSFLQSQELAEFVGNVDPLLRNIPTVILTVAFLGILITSFGLLLQALYLAGDMDFLLSAPLPIHSVFVAKLFQAILPNFCLILLFSLPVLVGLGNSLGYNPFFYLFSIVILGMLALAAAGLSSLLVMLVVRIFPARRVSEVIALFVAVISIICSQSGQLMNFEDISGEQVSQVVTNLRVINQAWLPLAWAGQGLVALGEGRWLTGIGLTSIIVLLSGFIFYGSLRLAELWYFTGWTNLRTGTRTKKASRKVNRRGLLTYVLESGFIRFFSPAVTAIIKKDILFLQRDLRIMSQLITPLILGIIYAFLLLRGGDGPPAGRGEAPDWFMNALNNLLLYANVGISLFVSWSLISRLAGMSFSQEGKSYWMLKSSPVSARGLITAKFFVAFIPGIFIGGAFLIVLSLLKSTPITSVVLSCLAVLFSIAGLVGLNLAFGVFGANFDWEDPRHMVKGVSGCLGALVSFLFLLLCMVFFFGPVFVAEIFRLHPLVGHAIGLVLGISVSLTGGLLPLRLVYHRVSLLGED